MAKIGNTFVALCSAAIGAIYMAGYVVTEPTQAQAASSVPLQSNTSQNSSSSTNASSSSTNSTNSNRSTRSSTSSKSGTQAKPKTSRVVYHDGTYTFGKSMRCFVPNKL